MMKTKYYKFIIVCVDTKRHVVYHGTGNTLKKAERDYKRVVRFFRGEPATKNLTVTRRMFSADIPFGKRDCDAQVWVQLGQIVWNNCDSIDLDHP